MCKLAYNLLKLFLLEVKGGKMETKFCEFCGNKVAIDAVLCPKCGKQLEDLKSKYLSYNFESTLLDEKFKKIFLNYIDKIK